MAAPPSTMAEPDIYYADETYTSQGPVTEEVFLAAWQAKKVHGWPDKSLVWWTDLEGGWVPLQGSVARQRFGSRFAVESPVQPPREHTSDAAPTPKRLKTAAQSQPLSGQTSPIATAGVIDLSDDRADVASAPPNPHSGTAKPASAECIDLASDDEDETSKTPLHHPNDRARDPRVRPHEQPQPQPQPQHHEHGDDDDSQQPQVQQPQQQLRPQVAGSGWSGASSFAPVQSRDRSSSYQLTPREESGAAVSQPLRTKRASSSSESLWQCQCNVFGIDRHMIPAEWSQVANDIPRGLFYWLQKSLTSTAGKIVEISDLRRDKADYACTLTMSNKKAMLNAISKHALVPNSAAASGANGGPCLRIVNVQPKRRDMADQYSVGRGGGGGRDPRGAFESNGGWGGRGGEGGGAGAGGRDSGGGYGGQYGSGNSNGGGYHSVGSGRGGSYGRGFPQQQQQQQQHQQQQPPYGFHAPDEPHTRSGGAGGGSGSSSGWGGGGGGTGPGGPSQNGYSSSSGWGGGGGGHVVQNGNSNGNSWGGQRPPMSHGDQGAIAPGPGPGGRGAGSVVPAWVTAKNSSHGSHAGGGWGGSQQQPQQQQPQPAYCTVCGGGGVAGCPHRRDCEIIQQSIANGSARCYLCGGSSHDMNACPAVR
jgi:hypothetical protein